MCSAFEPLLNGLRCQGTCMHVYTYVHARCWHGIRYTCSHSWWTFDHPQQFRFPAAQRLFRATKVLFGAMKRRFRARDLLCGATKRLFGATGPVCSHTLHAHAESQSTHTYTPHNLGDRFMVLLFRVARSLRRLLLPAQQNLLHVRTTRSYGGACA